MLINFLTFIDHIKLSKKEKEEEEKEKKKGKQKIINI